ncbi:MAG TPA: YbhB/YbcL family Raf kinase inhibitor-like protein [Rhizomicrobium sp.]|nr:YbhB/YbcL family Raf kinase inhibitor-like protein [Rhizomicrobium sp.]
MRATIPSLALLLATPAAAMSISSSDFADGAMLPVIHNYTRCGGENVSPALSWKGVPKTAQSLVLTMIDIDVKPALWSHWVVVDLPPDSTGIAHGAKALPGGAHAVGSNFGDTFYDGPCPPEGSGVHHYRFTLWAMPRATTAPAPNAAAATLQAGLTQMAIDKATITGWVRR